MSNITDYRKIYDVNKLCRTCSGETDLQPLYEICKKEVSVLEMLICCTMVEYDKDDGLPVKICSDCINELKQAYAFARKCELTDIKLRKSLEPNQEQLKHVTLNNNKSKKDVTVDENDDYQMNILVPDIKIEVVEDKNIISADSNNENRPLSTEFCNIKSETSTPTSNQEYSNDAEVTNLVNKTSNNIRPTRNCKKIEPEVYLTEDFNCSSSSDTSNSIDLQQQICKKKGSDEETNSEPDLNSLHECFICQKSFKYVKSLEKHFLSHNDINYTYTCEICQQPFTNPQALNEHKNIFHDNIKKFECEFCQKPFAKMASLSIHRRIHTEEKPYTCQICNKSFRQKQHLSAHRTVHTGLKPHQCDVCSKFFSQTQHLRAHLRIHKNERPYSCDICNKKFTNLSDVTRHRRIHTGEKPFMCEVCGKGFTQATVLTRHRQTHNK